MISHNQQSTLTSLTRKKVEQNQKKKGMYDFKKVKSIGIGQATRSQIKKTSGAIGAIAIPEVNMHLPIMLGMSDDAMSTGGGTMRADQVMGKGNYPLAGHYMTAKGILFSPLEDVKQLYLDEFEDARLEYNSKQSRPSRMIDNYFDNVSNNEKKDLACEIILELGDKEYWDTKDENFKKKMSEVYKKQVDDLELLVPNFKVASAIIHYDETSPHLHIVGVPIKYKNKNGMEKQVGKSNVFTKESLIRLQDKMRTLCIEEFNQVYSLDSTLKQKQKGRNRDIHVSDMDNYIEMKKQIERNTENLKQANKKSIELKNNSKDIKDKIDKLKVSKLNKDNYILTKEDKDSFINFINQVDNTSKEYDKIQTLSNTLVNAHEQLKDKNNKIKTLTENNEALNLRVKALNDTIKEKDNEISFLKSKIQDLKNTLDYWKDKFEKLISFLHD